MKEEALRPQDMRSFRGATSEPPVDYQTEIVPEVFHDDDQLQEPIPVVVVDTVEPADYVDCAFEQFTIDGEAPVRIAGARDNRTRLIITNMGTEAVYLVRSANGGSFTGAPVPVNGIVELTTNRDVYATCADSETATIGVMQEFVIDDDR